MEEFETLAQLPYNCDWRDATTSDYLDLTFLYRHISSEIVWQIIVPMGISMFDAAKQGWLNIVKYLYYDNLIDAKPSSHVSFISVELLALAATQGHISVMEFLCEHSDYCWKYSLVFEKGVLCNCLKSCIWASWHIVPPFRELKSLYYIAMEKEHRSIVDHIKMLLGKGFKYVDN